MDSSLPEPLPAEPSRKRSRIARILDVVALAVIAAAAAWFVFAPGRLGSVVARPAPAVDLQAMAGGRFSLAQHRGRVVFLDFWASWCSPCQASLPLVEGWAHEHRGADVIAIDAGESTGAATRFAHELRLSNVAFDPQMSATHAFGIDGFPTMIVVDPRGIVRAKWIGFNPAVASAMSDAAAQFSAR